VTAVLAGAALIAGAGGGCASQPKKASNNEVAKHKWNAARGAALAGLAKDQFESGSLEQARHSITEAEKLDPENGSIRVLSAKLAIEEAQLELAERELRLARQFDPKNPEADYLSGVVYQRWQKPEVAYEFYGHASDKAPAELAYIMAKAEMLVAMDRAPEALKLLQEKVVYFEQSAAIRDAVGQLLVGQKEYAKAADMLRQASVLTPDDLMIREHLGLALYYAKQYEDSVATLTKLLKEEKYEKRSDLWATVGECQSQLGQFREARDSFETATKIDPSSGPLWLGFGKAALQHGDLRRAELALRRAAAIDPSATEVSLLTGYLRMRQDRLPEALAAFKKASSADNADALSLCMTGYVLQKMGKTDEAMQYYGKALKRNPHDELANKLMAGVAHD
jgi:tetratricopeptide (TPR) repeat protein